MATPTPVSYLRNAMDRGAWQATVHGVTKESDMILETKQQQQNQKQDRKGQQCGQQCHWLQNPRKVKKYTGLDNQTFNNL